VAAEHHLPAWALAFASGGDFQFIASASPRHDRMMASFGFRRIGHINSKRQRLLRLSDGGEKPLPRTGHRDARNMTFCDEIATLAKEAAYAK